MDLFSHLADIRFDEEELRLIVLGLRNLRLGDVVVDEAVNLLIAHCMEAADLLAMRTL